MSSFLLNMYKYFVVLLKVNVFIVLFNTSDDTLERRVTRVVISFIVLETVTTSSRYLPEPQLLIISHSLPDVK
jgi:hypothetical protein